MQGASQAKDRDQVLDLVKQIINRVDENQFLIHAKSEREFPQASKENIHFASGGRRVDGRILRDIPY